MSEEFDDTQETVDVWLRETMAAPEPRLSLGFDRELARRIQRPRLSAGGRTVMVLYGVVALALSVWLMRSQRIAWGEIAAAVGVALLCAVLVSRGFRQTSTSSPTSSSAG
jgi:hypothetical protein